MAKKRDKSIAIKVVELILAAFIAKGLGFVREMVLANYYGTSYVSDVFVAVQNIPAIIFTVFGTAVTTGFIPLYTEIKVKKNKELADRFANNVFNIFCLLSVFLTILGVLFSNQLVKLFAGGFQGETFILCNQLSDKGGVTRGICKMDDQNNLTEVVETKNIVKTEAGAEADGMAVDVNSLVSMNMWGLTPEFLDVLEEGFKEFFKKEVPGNPLKAEYLIPIFIGELLEWGKMSVKVLKTNDTWYGMTYYEDVAAVKDSFKKMLENGVYKADLFSDL